MWSRFKTFDIWLFLIPFLLMVISVVMIYTLTSENVGNALAVRQAIYAGIGVVFMLLLTFLDYRVLRSSALWLFIGIIVALLAVKLFGKNDFGAQRWIEVAGFQFQPGEVAKLISPTVIAAILSHYTSRVPFRAFITSIGVMLSIAVLVLLEPDLGTALMGIITGLTVLLSAHLQRYQRVLIAGGVLLSILFFMLSFHGVKPFTNLMKEYQKNRLASFVEPSRDSSGTGYNVIQSVIAVGSGGLYGRGLGGGSQSQLNFLPVAHADFIFAGIAEAWGFAGSLGVLTLYAILIIRILLVARIAKDEFGMLLCLAIASKILFEMVINIGMNMRVMPVTGIPLPFLSYGGTTMITNSLCIGLVQSIVMRYKRLTFE